MIGVEGEPEHRVVPRLVGRLPRLRRGQPRCGGRNPVRLFACAALTSLFITDRPSTVKAAYGLPALAAGVVISLAGVLAESLPLYIVGSKVAGSGWAATFLSAMDNITAATPPAQRGQVFSSVFVASYLAFSVPAVIAGIVVSHIGLRDTIIGYVGYVLAMVMIAATFAVTMRRRATTAVRDSVEDAAAQPESACKG